MKRGCSILLFLLLWPALLFAQGGRFTATASSDEVAVGQQFEVDFTAQGDASDFTPPDFAGFQVLSGPNLSQSMTSVNGATSYSTGYGYILMSVKIGAYTIGSASIVVNSHRLRSNPIKLRVVKGHSVQQNQQAQSNVTGNIPAGNSNDLAKSIFIRAVPDKTTVYQGQQLTVSYKVYFRISWQITGVDKAPDLNGFWNQDIVQKDKDLKRTVENYKGQQYDVITIKQSVLFPEHSGDLTIDPFAISLVAQVQDRSQNSIFDIFDGGGMKQVNYKIKSPPVTIHAMPLPEAGKPAGFSGAVGNFSVDAGVDKKELKANETLNYNLKISGSGNLALINAPAINPPADFEKYDPKVTDNIVTGNSGTSGSRQFNYLLIPRHKGDYVFSPPGFSYFNPETRRYVTLPAKTFSIKVNKGDAAASSSVFNAVAQQDVKLLGKDIRYIKTSSPNLFRDGEGFYGSPVFYLLLLLGPLGFASALLYRRWDYEQNSDLVRLKSRRANKIAAKHLSNAAKQLSEGNKTVFYEAVSRGLYGYISDKLNIPVADLNKENITIQLKIKGLDDNIIKQLDDTIDLCEMARFAPVTGISEKQVFDKAKNTINEIENSI